MKRADDLLKKIATYSSVTGAVIGINVPVSAELVGYDVDPDSTRFFPADTASYYEININNIGAACDSYSDFVMAIGSASWASSSNYIWIYGWYDNRALVNASVNEFTSTTVTNLFTSITASGKTASWTSTYIGSITFTFYSGRVGTLGSSAGQTHANESSWTNFATMAWIYSWTSWGDWAGKKEKYQGLQFYAHKIDTLTVPGETIRDSTFHYGWIYMDLALGAQSYTIKAWAYEDTPWKMATFNMDSVNWNKACTNENIKPGIQERDLTDNISIYSFNRSIKVSLQGIRSKGNISIYNMSGQRVQEQAIKGNSNLVIIKGDSRGIYMVKVDVDGVGTRSKKVFIE